MGTMYARSTETMVQNLCRNELGRNVTVASLRASSMRRMPQKL